MVSPFAGTQISVSDRCFEMVPIFPDKPRTKRRLRRTRGRFGRLDRLQPLAFQTPYGLVVHPSIYEKLQLQYSASRSHP